MAPGVEVQDNPLRSHQRHLVPATPMVVLQDAGDGLAAFDHVSPVKHVIRNVVENAGHVVRLQIAIMTLDIWKAQDPEAKRIHQAVAVCSLDIKEAHIDRPVEWLRALFTLLKTNRSGWTICWVFIQCIALHGATS